MTIKITGLDNIKRNLSDLQGRFRSLNGTHNLVDILTPEFIQRCSRFKTLEELFESSGFEIKNLEDLKNIPDEQWDIFICSNTKYRSWEKMLQEGGQKWVEKKLSTNRF